MLSPIPQPDRSPQVSTALREALASRGEPREFIPLNPDDPRIVASLRLISARKADTEVVSVREYERVLLNGAGKIVRDSENVSIEERPEDVTDVIAFYRKDQEIFAAVTEVSRPALFSREQEPLVSVPEQLTGKMVNLPGGFITEAGPESSAKAIVVHKIGATAVGEPFPLGGTIIPNAGCSSEKSIPFGIEVQPPEHAEMVSFGDKLDGTRVVRYMELQEIVNEYYAGRLHDPRLLEITFRLAEHMHYPLEIPFRKELEKTVENHSASEFAASRTLTRQAARDLIQNPPPDSGIVASVLMKPATQPSERPFLQPYRLTVQNFAGDGSPLGLPFEIDAVVRRFDTLNVGCFSLVENEPVLAINIGAREALESREQELPYESPIRALQILTDARTWEGVTGSVSPRASAGSGLEAAASRIAEQHTGIQTFGRPFVLGTYYFSSPGFNSALTSECLIPFDASQLAQLNDACYLMRARDILTLADEGIVRDLHLIQMARRLDAAFPSKIAPEAPAFPEEVVKFMRYVATRDQRLARISAEYAPEMREEMKVQPLLATMIARRLGMRASKVDVGATEEVFFDSHMETYLFHPEMSGTEAIAFLLHDCWHYEHPDKLPFHANPDGTLLRDAAGNAVVCTLKEYGVNPNSNEVDALMFSEVVIPGLYGIEEFEQKIGKKTVASLLRGAGIIDLDEQHAAVQLMAVQGKIPEKVARFLAEGAHFKDYQFVLRERLIGFYVRDVLNNVPAMYKAWTEKPEVAELAIQMGAPAFNGLRRIPETFTARRDAMLRGPRSINPLQDEIEDTRKNDLYRPILNIAALGALIDKHAEPDYRDELRGEMKAQIAKLKAAEETLKALLATIKDTEHSHRNLSACAALLDIRTGACREGAQFFERLVQDEKAIGAENVQELAGRKYVGFPLIPFGVPEGGQSKVTELISNSFTDIGLPVPPS